MTDPITRLNAALEGRYRLEHQIGEGGMATVYLAEDLRHERKVALKVLKPELAAVVGAERFLAEIKTTANLQHPHILPLFDSGQAESFLYYVMPYVEGDTLRDKIDREKQLGIEEALRITEKVASALDHAHKHGVVHRDIKPGNILLNPEGEPTVADFGIALAVAQAGGGRVTETGLSVGTPHYMSPEQATGDRDVDPRTDVYALGCVLYEMLVGEPPYSGSTAQAILGKIIQGNPISATEARGTVPPNVDAAIRKALEKLPADRFTTAQEFAGALGDAAFRHGEDATVAANGSLWNPLSIATSGVAAIAILALGWSLLRPDPPRLVTRVSVNVPEDQGFDPVRGDLDLSADGSLMVYRGVGVPGGQLWVRRYDALDATPIPGTDSAARPAISPDGQEVAFQGAGGLIPVVPVQGGVGRILTESASTSGATPRWSPDGAWIYFTDAAEGLSRMPSGGGTAEVVTEVDTAAGDIGHVYPDVLPGGHAVYTVFGTGAPRIQAVDVRTGEVKDIMAGRYPRYSATGHLLFQDATQSILFAATFDTQALALTSAPQPLAEGLIPVGFGGTGLNPGSFAVSRTGRLVYRVGADAGAGLQLVLVDREGQEEPLNFEPQNYRYPHLSADGDRLAVASAAAGVGATDFDLWVFDLRRGSRSRVTFGGNNQYYPIWTAAGDRLTFSDGNFNGNTIYLAAADGSGQTETLLERELQQFPTSWSPDGNVLAFHETHPETLRDLWVLPQGGEPEPILVTPFQERNAVFSPDGQWLAYESDRSGRYEVYVRPYPGPGSEITISTGGGLEPIWSPTGLELFYRTPDQMMVVAVDLTDEFRAEVPQVLFDDPYVRGEAAANYDVAPDGEHFVMLSAGSYVAQGTLILVQNFFEELRQVVGDN